MTNYVLGFAFTENDDVALIEKQKPEWQKGLWNGIGGKREYDADTGWLEDSIYAVSREFKEETGVYIPESEWDYVGYIDGDGWDIDVFTTTSVLVNEVKTIESERVLVFPLDQIQNIRTVENVPLLIEMCLLHQKLPENKRPKMFLRY